MHGNVVGEFYQNNLKVYGLVFIQGKLDQAEPIISPIRRTGATGLPMWLVRPFCMADMLRAG
jgi:hypothetical protein